MKSLCTDCRRNTETGCRHPKARGLALTCDGYISPAENDAKLDKIYKLINTERQMYETVMRYLEELKTLGMNSPIGKELEFVLGAEVLLNTPDDEKSQLEKTLTGQLGAVGNADKIAKVGRQLVENAIREKRRYVDGISSIRGPRA